MAFWDEEAADDDDAPVLLRRRVSLDVELDMTPMIDVTFLLLIFFLVSSALQKSYVDLPKARFGAGVDPRASVVVTVANTGQPGKPSIYLGDGKEGSPLASDPLGQENAVRAALERGLIEGKTQLLLKGEQGLKVGDVKRILSTASSVEGIRLFLAVKEGE